MNGPYQGSMPASHGALCGLVRDGEGRWWAFINVCFSKNPHFLISGDGGTPEEATAALQNRFVGMCQDGAARDQREIDELQRAFDR